MYNKNLITRSLLHLVLFLIFSFSFIEYIAAQTGGGVDPMKLMRGKYWIKCLPNGALDRETTPNQWESLFPGNYSGLAESAGGWDNTAIYNGAIVAGQPTAWFYRAAQFNSSNIYSVTPASVSRNYDLVNIGRAEGCATYL